MSSQRGSNHGARGTSKPSEPKRAFQAGSGMAPPDGTAVTCRDWALTWFGRLVRFHRIEYPQSWQFTRDEVINFLLSEKERGAPTWKRLKIVESLQYYQRFVRNSSEPDLDDIRAVLQARVIEEQQLDPDAPTIEEAVGVIDPNEPEAIRELRRIMRLHQRELETERAYVRRVRQFMRKWELDSLASFDRITPKDVEAHLSELAVDENVAESTQNVAFYALLFLFRHVLKRDLQYIDAIRSTKPKRIPTVMSREEVVRVFANLSGVYLTMGERCIRDVLCRLVA
jgi:hypothetical protein